MASETTIATVADKIKAVVNRGTLNWSGNNTTASVSAGYYTGGTLDSRPSYNSGRSQGQNDVKNSPNSYSLYTKSQYDSNYNNGYKAGVKSTSGTASALSILTGKTAWVNGSKITGTMKDYSSAKQTATTSTSDQTKSCYRTSNGYIDIVPAIGYWGSWDWNKSYVRVPASSALQHTYLKLKSSNSRFGFKYYTSSGSVATDYWFYVEYNWSFTHQIVSAFIYIDGVAGGDEYYMLSADGRCCQLADRHWVALNLTHPDWSAGYFPFPVNKPDTTYTLSIWYV